MLMIRYQRIGRANDPAFRIVVLEKERAAKAGNIVEQVGTYNPRSKALTLDEDKVKEWIAKGAQPTDTVRNLLITKGVLSGRKINVLPKKTPQGGADVQAQAPETPAASSAETNAPAAEPVASEADEVTEEAATAA
jgi:small subunit ribosomal protein S16